MKSHLGRAALFVSGATGISLAVAGLAVALSGCQLIVDFNRALIEGGVDGAFYDANFETGVDAGVDADATIDAPVVPDAVTDVVYVDGHPAGGGDAADARSDVRINHADASDAHASATPDAHPQD
jgi:hypothetical protein